MTQFWNNTKTAILLGLMFGVLIVAGRLIGGPGGMTLALVLGGFGAVISFFFSDKIAISAMRGEEVTEQNAPDLVHMVERLAKNANLPMPRVYICPQQAPNAFATGRSPNKAAVAVTRGALQLLSYDELEGVMAHELAHVKNRDTLISTVAAVIAGALTYLGYMGLFFGGGRDNPLGVVGMLLMILVAPIAAALIQMAISRSREYVADADAAEIAGTPQGLISALQKLDAMNKRVKMEHEMPSQNHMFIVQPLSGSGGLTSLFSTHPATEDRIAKLRQLG